MAKVMTAKVKLQCPGGQATPFMPPGSVVRKKAGFLDHQDCGGGVDEAGLLVIAGEAAHSDISEGVGSAADA